MFDDPNNAPDFDEVVYDEKEHWPQLKPGDSITVRELSEILPFPWIGHARTPQEYKKASLARMNMCCSWMIWHLSTFKIAIKSNRDGSYRALHPHEQVEYAHAYREQKIHKGVQFAEQLLTHIHMDDPELREEIRAARIYNAARKRWLSK